MSLPIVFRLPAQCEYDEAAEWYERRQAGLSDQFTAEVEATLEKIAARPERYPIVLRDVRQAPTQRFPFCVYFRVRSEKIVVLSVFHESRDPQIWRSRVD